MKNLKIITTILIALGVILLVNCKKDECENVPCGGSTSNPKVDLIVLVDASGSMGTTASTVSQQADSAITLALAQCPSDLRVTYLGVAGTWAGTKFTQGHKSYLTSIGAPFNSNANAHDGAMAIDDLSKNFDWRNGACKAIFFISDEIFTRGDSSIFNSALNSANSNNVTISANYLTYQNRPASVLQNYTDITTQTGGSLFTTPSNPIPTGYYIANQVFDNLICNACNNCGINITK